MSRFEGFAICINNEGLEDDLVLGKAYYVLEVLGMGDHGIVFSHKNKPLVGIDLDRFNPAQREDLVAEVVFDEQV